MILECQYCNRRILTDIEHETTWIGLMGSLILFLVFKVFALPLIMLLIPLTQKTVHKCTNCLNTVGTHTFYDILSLSDKIFSFKVGNFALIFTRKQLIGVFMFTLFSIVIYLFLGSMDLSRGSKLKLFIFINPTDFIDADWNKFKKYCSREEFENNPKQAEIYCKTRFKYSDVSWKGKFTVYNKTIK